MAEACGPDPVNLICGVLAGRPEWLGEARTALEGAFGPVDLASDTWSFDYTDYYELQMGPSLLRRFYSFRELIDPGELPGIKLRTNVLEDGLSRKLDGPERPVNLDPGYVCAGKLVLATTKDQAHRVYLGRGIYAECTLRWHDGGFETWEWTYRDYASEPYREFLAQVRDAYMQKLTGIGSAGN